MKSIALSVNKPAQRIVAITGLSLALFTSLVYSAFAAEVPTITGAVLTGANATTTAAAIGTSVHAWAQVATASTTLATPVGTVDFALYPNTTCVGTATTQAGVAIVNGVAVSAATTVPATGLSYKAHYNGQTNVFTPVDSACMPVTALSSTVTVTNTLSTASAAVGTSVHDTAVLAGVTATAGGTISYSVFTDSACSASTSTAGTKTVTNGIAQVSNDVAFATAGTYYWRSVYSGDASNAAATSTCASAQLVIATTPVPPTGTAVLSGQVYNDLNKNGVKDAGEVGLAGWKINLFKGAGWWKFGAPIQTVTTAADGTYAFAAVADGTYSVEQVITSGWSQLTDDFNNVVITSGVGKSGLNFGDAQKGKGKKNGRENRMHFKHHWRSEGVTHSSEKSEKGESRSKDD